MYASLMKRLRVYLEVEAYVEVNEDGSNACLSFDGGSIDEVFVLDDNGICGYYDELSDVVADAVLTEARKNGI